MASQLVSAPVQIDSAADVESFDLAIKYDPAVLTFEDADLGDLGYSDPVWEVNDAEPGVLMIGVANPETLPDRNGVVVELQFRVAGSVVPGQRIVVNIDTASLNEGALTTMPANGSITIVESVPAVVGRHLFYNNSAFDGSDPDPNAEDDHAIASDKTALLPGETATTTNYTSYSRGINGLMIDLAGLPAGVTPGLADFEFHLGNDDNPNAWSVAPAPSEITFRAGAGVGQSDRVTIVWSDGAIRNRWLQVTVKTADLLLARNNPREFLNPAAIDFPYDYNRDTHVNATDVLLARNNRTSFLCVEARLQLFDQFFELTLNRRRRVEGKRHALAAPKK